MSTRDNQHGLVESGVDQAALLGVGLAATISISASDGDWEFIESIIGVVLLCLVLSFLGASGKTSPSVRPLRWVAVAGVQALCCCLILAYPIQKFFEQMPARIGDMWLPLVFGAYLTAATAYGEWTGGASKRSRDRQTHQDGRISK
jgi:hypothetical protein